MGAFSIWHWVVVLAIVRAVVWHKKLRNLGGDLGAAIRGFRKGMKEDGGNATAADGDSANLDKPVVEAEATETATASTAAEMKDKQHG